MKPGYRNICLTVMVVLVLLPFVLLALWSLSSRWHFPDLWPQAWGLRAWQYALGGAGWQFISGLGYSVGVAAVSSVISTLVALPAGRVLGLYAFSGKGLAAILLMLPVIVPPLCVAMGLHLWFIHLGLADTFSGVVLAHLAFCTPYAIFVLWGGFSNYNPEFEAQARSLGAGPVQVLTRVMLPLVWPGIVVATLFAFLLSWSQYLSTLIIGGGRITTLPILLFALMGSGDRPVAAAVSIVFVAPALLALLLSTRFLGSQTFTGIR